MRVVKLVWNEALSATSSYSIESEIMVEDDDAEEAGRHAVAFVDDFRRGMAEGTTE